MLFTKWEPMISNRDSKANRIQGLYLVTDRSLCIHHSLEEIVRRSVKAGVRIVQLREKEISTKEFLSFAKHILGVLRPFQVPLIINDRLDVALTSGADGIHLGQSDLPYGEARKYLGPEAIIGLSIETKSDLLNLPLGYETQLDYLGASPVFSTPTKTDTKEPWGLVGLQWLKEHSKLPLVAIGGINLSNAKQVTLAGADSLAVVSYLCSAEDPEANVKRILEVVG